MWPFEYHRRLLRLLEENQTIHPCDGGQQRRCLDIQNLNSKRHMALPSTTINVDAAMPKSEQNNVQRLNHTRQSNFCMCHLFLSSPVHLLFAFSPVLSPTLFRLVEIQAVPTAYTTRPALPRSTIWMSTHHVPRVLSRCLSANLPSSLSMLL